MQSTLGTEDDELTGKAALLLLEALLPLLLETTLLLLLLKAGQYGMWVPPTIAQALCESSAQLVPTRQLIMSSEALAMLEELLVLGELNMLEPPVLEEESSDIGGKSSMSELVQFANIIAKAKMVKVLIFIINSYVLMWHLIVVSISKVTHIFQLLSPIKIIPISHLNIYGSEPLQIASPVVFIVFKLIPEQLRYIGGM
jgi:hypothetical protein